jgi:hypothetical protein
MSNNASPNKMYKIEMENMMFKEYKPMMRRKNTNEVIDV